MSSFSSPSLSSRSPRSPTSPTSPVSPKSPSFSSPWMVDETCWSDNETKSCESTKKTIVRGLGRPDNVLQLLSEDKELSCNFACDTLSDLTMDGIESIIMPLLKTVTKGKWIAIGVFKCIKIIYDKIGCEVLMKYSSDILEAMDKVWKMKNDNRVKNAVMVCLDSVLLVFDQELNNNEKSKFLMRLIIDACGQDESEILQFNGLRVLLHVCKCYYNALDIELHMKTVFMISTKCIQKAVKSQLCDDKNAMVCIEIWSTIAEIEMELGSHSNIVSTVLFKLCKVYFNSLAVYYDENDPDYDTYDIHKACSASLELLSKCCKNKIISNNNKPSALMVSIVKNITNKSWKLRDASLVALGSILYGPDKSVLKSEVLELLPIIPKLMIDKSSSFVRTSATWVFGRLCKLFPEQIIKIPKFSYLIKTGLDDRNSVSQYSAWALALLAEYYDNQKLNNSPLRQTEHAKHIIKGLLDRAARKDSNDKVINACFESINTIIHHSPKNDSKFQSMIKSLLPFLIKKLQRLKSHQKEYFISVFSTVSVVLEYSENFWLSKENAKKLVKSCVKVSPNDVKVVKESLLCISWIITTLNCRFIEFLKIPPVQSYFEKCIDNLTHKNIHVSKISMKILSECLITCSSQLQESCKSKKNNKLLNFINEIIDIMLNMLPISDRISDKVLIFNILQTFCDIIISFGKYSTKFIQKIILASVPLGKQEFPEKASNNMKSHIHNIRIAVIQIIRVTIKALIESKNYKIICNKLLPQCVDIIKIMYNNPFEDSNFDLSELILDIYGLNPKKYNMDTEFNEENRSEFIKRFLMKVSVNPNSICCCRVKN